jgi:hypothetical protein
MTWITHGARQAMALALVLGSALPAMEAAWPPTGPPGPCGYS